MARAEVILASASPRRRELLSETGVRFTVEPSPVSEPTEKPAELKPEAWAQALAYFKARHVARDRPRRWVLGADTIVACETSILGKPADEADARRMLERQGRCPSDVITGVCLVRADGELARLLQQETTRIWMHDSRAAREAYLASGDWRGKAGAYGIQDVGDRLVARRVGSFSNVVGLPVERVRRMLRAVGIRR